MWMLMLFIITVQTGYECRSCPENCATCRRSTRSSCDTCNVGYYGNGCWSQCSHACVNKQCDKNGGYCTCIEGYELYYYDSSNGRQFICCPENCYTCTISSTCTGCNAGYFGSKCEECPDNCATCTSLTDCTSCNAGYFGSKCEPCRNCRNNACTIHGWCTDGCKDGHYRDSFDCEVCPDNCAMCSSSNTCTSCNVGHYGSKCDKTCLNCRNNKCSIDGRCIDGCLEGYYPKLTGCCPSNCVACTPSTECTSCNAGNFGRTCENRCLNCKNDFCSLENGSCSNGCNDGYYEEMTGCKPCPVNCSVCRSDTECDECAPGYYGTTCQQQCPQNCDTCEGDANCLQCHTGYYGQSCGMKCSSSCNNGCSKKDGECNGCIDSYYEEDGHCNECSDGCAICENIDVCIRCQNGFFSKNTTDCNACGVNCSTCNDTDSCTECNEGYANVNGSCLSCQNCNDSTACLSRNVCYQCIDGFFGSYCGGKCNETCIRCDKSTGECIECKDNTFGVFCEQKCSRHCLQSLDNNSTCWKQNGTCKDGCKKEYAGPYCNAEISSATSPQVAMIVGSTSGVVAIVIVIIVVVIMMYRMRVKQQGSNGKGAKPRGSLGPRAANEVVNQAYDDMNTYPTTVSGHQSNHSGEAVDSADHVYFVLQEASPQKPAQPNKAHVHDVNNVETDNVYDLPSGGNGPGMQADIKMSQDQGDTYSHISHASLARQLRYDDEGAYDHVTRHNIQKGDGDETYDVTSGLHGYDIHVKKTSKQSADEYSTIRHVQ